MSGSSGETKISADFLVKDGIFTYLVEVTSKQEGDYMFGLLAEAKETGWSEGTRGISHNNTLDGIIQKKAKQLAETRVKANFQVLWISAFHRDWKHLASLLLRTLYGAARLITHRSLREPPEIRECLYYHRFSFYRARNLDAVVFSTPEQGMLCVNDLSDRAEKFRESKLYTEFDAPLDPVRASEKTLVIPPEVDRSQPNAQWRYLKEHKGLMTSVMVECDYRSIMSLEIVCDSFQQFVEAVVLPRLLENPGDARLDGWTEAKGNWEVAGRFRFDGQVWKAHEDCRYEPLLLAYWSAMARGEEQTFVRADTEHGVRLDLVHDLQALRTTRHRYLYLYLDV
ncbi:MAG: hypothetical protein R3F30_12525 [Planctomycetota bacterium]